MVNQEVVRKFYFGSAHWHRNAVQDRNQREVRDEYFAPFLVVIERQWRTEIQIARLLSSVFVWHMKASETVNRSAWSAHEGIRDSEQKCLVGT